jgi:hypothetical protein
MGAEFPNEELFWGHKAKQVSIWLQKIQGTVDKGLALLVTNQHQAKTRKEDRETQKKALKDF